MFKGATHCLELRGGIFRAIDFEILWKSMIKVWFREILIDSLNSEVNSVVITYVNRSLESIFYWDSSHDSICRAQHTARSITPRPGVSEDNVWNKERQEPITNVEIQKGFEKSTWFFCVSTD